MTDKQPKPGQFIPGSTPQTPIRHPSRPTTRDPLVVPKPHVAPDPPLKP
jgi:hypothetical protein